MEQNDKGGNTWRKKAYEWRKCPSRNEEEEDCSSGWILVSPIERDNRVKRGKHEESE